MSLRGSNLATATATNPLSVSFPAGSAVGDLAIAFCSGGAPITLPSGWTSLYSNSTFTWCLIACSKVLTSGDISTGSVSFTIGAGTFDMAVGIAVFVGSGGGVRETEGSAGGGGNVTLTNTTTSAVLNSDTAIYWASARNTSPTLPTITPGSGSATTLQSGTTTNAYSVLADQGMPGGALAVANGFTGAGAAACVAVQVIVELGLAPAGALLINPGMDGGMVPQMKGGMNG